MAISHVSAGPTSGTQGSSPVTLSVELSASGADRIRSITIRHRRNGGTWQSSTKAFPADTTSATHTRDVSVQHGDTLEWEYSYTFDQLPYLYGVDGGTTGPWSLPVSDATDPTISNATSAAGASVEPGASGVLFGCTVSDNMGLDKVEFWFEGTKQATTTFSNFAKTGGASWAKVLERGTYSWYVKLYDGAGRSATLAARNVTVINTAPTQPGVLSVNGKTSAITVARATEHTVAWGASVDYNPEDSVTYTLEARIAGGEWAEVATALAGLSQGWTPDTVGTWELRVKATDGTADSSYRTLADITVESSAAPNTPTIIDPE